MASKPSAPEFREAVRRKGVDVALGPILLVHVGPHAFCALLSDLSELESQSGNVREARLGDLMTRMRSMCFGLEKGPLVGLSITLCWAMFYASSACGPASTPEHKLGPSIERQHGDIAKFNFVAAS
jgi:hypothetical protein